MIVSSGQRFKLCNTSSTLFSPCLDK
uniref:Uncharacterized protein n=1 Tax=Rhizophora mucronata TaxID=61149 RepID=A0A2P2PAF9_RHIMU